MTTDIEADVCQFAETENTKFRHKQLINKTRLLINITRQVIKQEISEGIQISNPRTLSNT